MHNSLNNIIHIPLLIISFFPVHSSEPEWCSWKANFFRNMKKSHKYIYLHGKMQLRLIIFTFKKHNFLQNKKKLQNEKLRWRRGEWKFAFKWNKCFSMSSQKWIFIHQNLLCFISTQWIGNWKFYRKFCFSFGFVLTNRRIRQLGAF